jgi:hypothetical protein
MCKSIVNGKQSIRGEQESRVMAPGGDQQLSKRGKYFGKSSEARSLGEEEGGRSRPRHMVEVQFEPERIDFRYGRADVVGVHLKIKLLI